MTLKIVFITSDITPLCFKVQMMWKNVYFHASGLIVYFVARSCPETLQNQVVFVNNKFRWQAFPCNLTHYSKLSNMFDNFPVVA